MSVSGPEGFLRRGTAVHTGLPSSGGFDLGRLQITWISVAQGPPLKEWLWRVTTNKVQTVPSFLRHCSDKSQLCRRPGIQNEEKSHSHPLWQCLAQSVRCQPSLGFIHHLPLLGCGHRGRRGSKVIARIPTPMQQSWEWGFSTLDPSSITVLPQAPADFAC